MDIAIWLKQKPEGASDALTALWWQGRGDWARAHQCVQNDPSAEGAWVHAHLHRVEGDPANAGYWYRRANRPEAANSPDEEWRELVLALSD